MNPDTINNLLAMPDFQAFVAFLREQADQLNRLDDIDPHLTSVAIEVKARQRAYKKLSEILTPLLNPQEKVTPSAPNKEFAM